MLAPTHSVFGIFFTLTILALFGVQASLNWTIIVFAILGAIIPDLDHSRSYIGRLLWFISRPLERKFGHRSITHSFLGWFIATVLLCLIFVLVYFLTLLLETHTLNLALTSRWLAAFSLAYLSHLILDMFNPRGSQLFWPNSKRDVILKNSNLRPKSGSRTEIVLFLIFFIFMLLSFPISKYGVLTSLRWLLATPESVIQEMQSLKTKMYLEFEGIYRVTKSPVKGNCEILNFEGKKLIVLFNTRVFTLSEKSNTDIITANLRFQKTNIPLQLTQKNFEHKTKFELLALLPTQGLISGMIYLPQNLKVKLSPTDNFSFSFFDTPTLSSYKTITQIGSTLLLNYATKKEIANLQWDETFELTVLKNKTQLARLSLDLAQLSQQLNSSATDLTQQYLDLQLQETKLKIQELNLSLKKMNMLFSGNLIFRN